MNQPVKSKKVKCKKEGEQSSKEAMLRETGRGFCELLLPTPLLAYMVAARFRQQSASGQSTDQTIDPHSRRCCQLVLLTPRTVSSCFNDPRSSLDRPCTGQSGEGFLEEVIPEASCQR